MVEKHLGGHCDITHVDCGALEFIIKEFCPKTMLDIGCGPGGMIAEAKRNNIDAIGIDGFPGKNKEKDVTIIIHDFTKGFFEHKKEFDLGWSCEFVEHVEEKYQKNYMNSFSCCKVVAMTFAPPGKRGHHHVNCRTQEYWIDIFQKNGFLFDKKHTENFRQSSSLKNNFVRNYGLIFIKV